MPTRYIILGLSLLSLASLAFAGTAEYRYYLLSQEYERSTGLLASSTSVYATVLGSLREKFGVVTARNTDLSASLTVEQTKNDFFQAQINGVKGAVDTLVKLSKTDKELLQKYSKVYFLNENYIPERLIAIEPSYLYNGSSGLQIHADIWPFLKRLMDAARADGIHLKVISAYRSFGTQAALKSDYKTTFGSGANTFSADQGYSEHQLASTLDFTTDETGADFSRFKSSSAYAWLQAHAHEYGFVLSYPENNAYYVFEPWHWRFVGAALAARLHSEGKHFYDLDQRTIDGYLALIFD